MAYLKTVQGSDAFLDSNNPSTWDITVRLERHHKYYTDEIDADLQAYEYEGWDAKAIALGLRTDIIENDSATKFVKDVRDTDAWTGKHLRSKIDALASFPFRVLTKSGEKPCQRGGDDDRSSFICLSYRWWSDWVKGGTGRFPLSPALRVDGYNGNFDIPDKKFVVSDCMWNALLAERANDSEGIWVDQMCLEQDDVAEVHSAVSSMNILYMTARKVVIVIEDVLLWSDEVRPMIKHAEQINSVPVDDRKKWTQWTTAANPLVLGASACALFKIEGSSWFRRVWCNHELQTGCQFTFLIPVMERELPAEGVDSVTVLKLDAKALATFIEASRHLASPSDLNDFLWRGWFDNIQEDKDVGNEPRVFYGFNAATNFSKKVDTPETTLVFKAHNWPTSGRSAMRLLSDALLFDEAHPRDILAVLLNTKYPTLAYSGTDPTIPEIVWLLNVAALAHSDLSPLLTACRLNNWSDKKIADVPFERYSWAAWPDQHYIDGWDRPLQGLRVNYEITDEGLKLVVAAAGSSETIRQMQEIHDMLSPLEPQFAAMLKFDKVLEQDQRRSDKAMVNEDEEKLEVHPTYVQHFLHAYFYMKILDDDTKARIIEEFSDSSLVSEDLDIAAALRAHEKLPSELKSFDAEPGTEEFEQLRQAYQSIRPLVKFVDALVTCLIAPEFSFKSGNYDDTIYISTVSGFNQEGDEWTVLASLPSKKEHGFYWIVRPDTLVEASNPEVQKELGIHVSFKFGGTWAVQIEGVGEEESQSMEMWNRTGNEEVKPYKELEEDAVRMKLLSRNIRTLPSEPWNRPLYTKTGIVHA